MSIKPKAEKAIPPQTGGQVTAKQFASSAAKFLSRAQMAPGERDEFAMVESILGDILQSKLVIGAPIPEAVAK